LYALHRHLQLCKPNSALTECACGGYPSCANQDLKKFLDEAKDGFIYFSMGSNFNGSVMREGKRKALMAAFSELPQRVVWKLEANSLRNTAPNVWVSKWLPQSDILGK
jgi:glucuronosyltransferase